MKRKVLAMVLALAMSFSMTACGDSKKEETKKQETQVDSEDQDVVETPEELNEYGVTDEEMQLLLERFKTKVEEDKDFYKKIDEDYEELEENYKESVEKHFWVSSERRTLLDAQVFYASLEEIWKTCFIGDNGFDFKKNKDLETVFYSAVKEWQEEDHISEENCIAFLGKVVRDWQTFKDTYLEPAYEEAMGY